MATLPGAARTLKSTVSTLALRALVLAFGRGNRECSHDDEAGYTVIDGKTIHCKCGQSFTVKCMCIRHTVLLPRVLQCVDCGKTMGYGEDPK